MLEFECSFINNQKQNHSLVEFKSECGTVLVCSSWESEHATMFVHTMRKLNFQMDYVKHRNLCKICIFIISMCNLKFSVLKQININWITDYTAGSNRLIYLSLDFFSTLGLRTVSMYTMGVPYRFYVHTTEIVLPTEFWWIYFYHVSPKRIILIKSPVLNTMVTFGKSE